MAGVVHSEDVHDGQHSVANEEDVNDNNITNIVKLADHVQHHGGTQEHQEKAGHGLGDGDCD